MVDQEKITQTLSSCQEILGFSHYGWSELKTPPSIALYESWLREGHHGDMQYLKDHLPAKKNPQEMWPLCKSILSFAFPYFPKASSHSFPLKGNRTALYAQGEDYHFWLKARLREMILKLKAAFPNHDFVAATDSAPILERDFAYQGRLGWVGKNTCIIHPKHGSLFLLGEIISTLPLQTTANPLPDFCGTCRRYIDACPTQAFTDERKLDAKKCISYLTIESRKLPAEELRPQMQDWLFGCDICQTVCPWNQKIFKGSLESSPRKPLNTESRSEMIKELHFLLTASGKKIQKYFSGTPLLRAGPFGLRRNAMIVTANVRLWELKEILQSYADQTIPHQRSDLAELAQWALQELEKPESPKTKEAP